MGNPPLHKARRRFGQNFLNDTNIIDRIVRSINPKQDDNLIEIGPGQGALTAPLVESCPQLQAIEIDRDLIPGLLAQFAKYPKFHIHKQDALAVDFTQFAERGPLRIVGNLPYNISTPLIFHLLSFNTVIQDMHFMLQKEVVERLAATPNNKNYGRLSIMVQYYCQAELLFEVPPECFQPKPKVDSAIIRLIPHKTPPYEAENIAVLTELVQKAFQQRRKTLRNSLKQWLSLEQLDKLVDLGDIDIGLRPENLSVHDYVTLSNQISYLDQV